MNLTSRDLRMYILVNSDIKINKGKLAGQVGHAVASYLYHSNDLRFLMSIEDYMNGAQKKIILKCSQKELEILENEGFTTIRDNGLTDLEPNTLTCVNMGIFDFNGKSRYLDYIKGLSLMR